MMIKRRHAHVWSPEEGLALRHNFKNGLSIEEIAHIHQRSFDEIKHFLVRDGLLEAKVSPLEEWATHLKESHCEQMERIDEMRQNSIDEINSIRDAYKSF